MAKTVELRRHTANDGDVLTPDGIRSAVEIGSQLSGRYDLLVSSGAPRATQTLACFLAGLGERFACGVTVDDAFRSQVEPRWFAAAGRATSGGLEAFLKVDPDLVKDEATRFGEALRRVLNGLPEDGQALIVGHSPMHEVAVYGLTGQMIAPISKGSGVLVIEDHGRLRVEPLT